MGIEALGAWCSEEEQVEVLWRGKNKDWAKK